MSKNWSPKLFSVLPIIGLLMYPNFCLSAYKERNNPTACIHRHVSGVYTLGERVQLLIAVLILSFEHTAIYGAGGRDGIGKCLITEKSMYHIGI